MCWVVTFLSEFFYSNLQDDGSVYKFSLGFCLYTKDGELIQRDCEVNEVIRIFVWNVSMLSNLATNELYLLQTLTQVTCRLCAVQ